MLGNAAFKEQFEVKVAEISEKIWTHKLNLGIQWREGFDLSGFTDSQSWLINNES